MKKVSQKNHFGLIGLVAIVLLSFGYILLSGSPGISSPDGNLTLGISTEAMPEGLSKSDVVIEDFTEEVRSGENTLGEAVVAAYLLSPGGTKFNAPIDFSFKYKADPEEVALPMIMHVSEESAEFMEPEITAENNIITYSDQIDHFSAIIVVTPPFEYSFIGAGRDYTVGDRFNFTVEVQKRYQGITYVNLKEKPHHYSSYEVGPVSEKHQWEVKPIKLTTLGDVQPSSTTLPGEKKDYWGKYSKTVLYTCAKEGWDQIRFPELITVKFVFDNSSDVPLLADKKIAGEGHKYELEGKLGINPSNTNLPVRCKKADPNAMVRIGPPYLIVDLQGNSCSGTQAIDARTGEPLSTPDGTPIDAETGKPACQ